MAWPHPPTTEAEIRHLTSECQQLAHRLADSHAENRLLVAEIIRLRRHELVLEEQLGHELAVRLGRRQ